MSGADGSEFHQSPSFVRPNPLWNSSPCSDPPDRPSTTLPRDGPTVLSNVRPSRWPRTRHKARRGATTTHIAKWPSAAMWVSKKPKPNSCFDPGVPFEHRIWFVAQTRSREEGRTISGKAGRVLLKSGQPRSKLHNFGRVWVDPVQHGAETGRLCGNLGQTWPTSAKLVRNRQNLCEFRRNSDRDVQHLARA